MTDSQDKQIRDYLLEKNLAIDLLLEVQDHMIAQIIDLQKAKGLVFDEAFIEVQRNWYADLRFPKYKIQFDLQDTTIFEKKIAEQNQIVLFKKSLLGLAALTMLLFLSAQILSQVVFQYVFISLVILNISVPVFQYYKSYKNFRLIKKYDNYKLTWTKESSKIALFNGAIFSSFIYNIKYHATAVYETLYSGLDGYNMITLFLFTFLFMMNIYCFYMQNEYLKKIEMIKPFLKYLKPSS